MAIRNLSAFAALCVASAALAQGPAPASKPSGDTAASAPAQDKPAKVVSVSGRAQKLLPGQEKWKDLAAGDLLDRHTIIRTGLRSRVVLKFQDRAEVIIEDATKVGISEFLQTGQRVKAKLGLKYGSLHVDVPKQNGPTDFSVSTPVATLSIRGTSGEIDFFSDSGLHLYSERGTWRIQNGLLYLDVGPGESGTGTFDQNLELIVLDLSTFLGDFFSGTDASERHFILTIGDITGRGTIIITGSLNTNTLTTPTGGFTLPPGVILVPGGNINIGDATTGTTHYSVRAAKTTVSSPKAR